MSDPIEPDEDVVVVDEEASIEVEVEEAPEVMSAVEQAPLPEPEVALADKPVEVQIAELTVVLKAVVAGLGVDAERNMKELFPILR